MGLLGAATEKAQFELTPTGEYVWTLWDMTSETGQYGEQVKWVYLLSPLSDPDAYIARNDGQEREIWQFTKPSLARGSRAREWAEALLNRELKQGEDPDDNDLIRRRMIAYLVHKPNKNDPTIVREAISAEIKPRPFSGAQVRPTSVSATPTDAEVNAVLASSDELRKRARKAVANAELSEVPGYEKWSALELNSMADADLEKLDREIRDAVKASMAAA